MIVMLRRSVWNRSHNNTLVVDSRTRAAASDVFSVTISNVRFASNPDTEKGTRSFHHRSIRSTLV